MAKESEMNADRKIAQAGVEGKHLSGDFVRTNHAANLFSLLSVE